MEALSEATNIATEKCNNKNIHVNKVVEEVGSHRNPKRVTTKLMIIVATPDRNITMVPPDLIEYRLISSFVKPRLDPPINSTTTRSLGRAWDEFIHDTFPSNEMKVHNFEFSVAPGISNTLLTEKAAARTGHRIVSSVRNIWTK